MPFRSGFRIARIVGIPIYLDVSWLLVFGVLTYDRSMQFRQLHPEWTPSEQWGLGVLTTLLFFGSVLFHELAHSVVAPHYKLKVISITLFFFGGLGGVSR